MAAPAAQAAAPLAGVVVRTAPHAFVMADSTGALTRATVLGKAPALGHTVTFQRRGQRAVGLHVGSAVASARVSGLVARLHGSGARAPAHKTRFAVVDRSATAIVMAAAAPKAGRRVEVVVGFGPAGLTQRALVDTTRQVASGRLAYAAQATVTRVDRGAGAIWLQTDGAPVLALTSDGLDISAYQPGDAVSYLIDSDGSGGRLLLAIGEPGAGNLELDLTGPLTAVDDNSVTVADTASGLQLTASVDDPSQVDALAEGDTVDAAYEVDASDSFRLIGLADAGDGTCDSCATGIVEAADLEDATGDFHQTGPSTFTVGGAAYVAGGGLGLASISDGQQVDVTWLTAADPAGTAVAMELDDGLGDDLQAATSDSSGALHISADGWSLTIAGNPTAWNADGIDATDYVAGADATMTTVAAPGIGLVAVELDQAPSGG